MSSTVAEVETGGRLHFGFANLSLAHDRLYGACGVALDTPRTRVSAAPAGSVTCEHDRAREFTARACSLLDVPGAHVEVEESLPTHMGLGSGTQLALAVLYAVAEATGTEARVRERAPALGRGGRSGVGVAAFERGGFVLDAGHPSSQFTSEPPDVGDWTVPPVAARHPIPEEWRFLLVIPDAAPGRSGAEEDTAVRATVEGADPGIADRAAGLLIRRVLPAVASRDRAAFGRAVSELGRLTGTWFAGEQGGIYRPSAGDVISALDGEPTVSGTGQSSWGPTVYGVTSADRAEEAKRAGLRALDAAGIDGSVSVVQPRNEGARSRRKDAASGNDDL